MLQLHMYVSQKRSIYAIAFLCSANLEKLSWIFFDKGAVA